MEFPRKTVPDLLARLRGKSVLDYGCGAGLQAVWIARNCGANVTGYDPYPSRDRWTKHDGIPRLRFTDCLPSQRYDVVMSISAFEHMADPAGELRRMAALVATGGSLIVTWAEPWFSPWGAHMGHFCRLPWVNLVFSEATVLHVRRDYSPDGATRYEGVERGLNRMTVEKWERTIREFTRESVMTVEYQSLTAVKRIPFVTSIPVVRELLTNAATVILRRP